MSVENKMEKALQHKLNELQIAPPAAAWPHIHEALHPPRRRRIIWWVLPLLGALVLAGMRMRLEPQNTAKQPTPIAAASTVQPNNQTPQAIAPGNARANTAIGHAKGNNAAQKARNVKAAGNNGSIIPQANASLTNASNEISIKATNAYQKQAGQKANAIAATPVPAAPQKSKAATEPGNASEAAIRTTPVAAAYSTAEISPDLLPLQPIWYSDATVELPTMGTASWPWPLADTIPAAFDGGAAKPNAQANKRGQWGAYLNAGVNNVVDGFSAAKVQEDFNSGSGTGNIIRRQASAATAGATWQAGMVYQQPLGKRFAFQTGMGIGMHHWQGQRTNYRDSIAPSGIVVQRSVTSSEDLQYRLWSLDVPTEFLFHFSKKTNQGFSLGAGLLHRFTLRASERLQTTFSQGGFQNLTSTISNSVRSYQPQVRLSLVYSSGGRKWNWQIAPSANYALPTVFKTGANQHLLQYQLHYRLFWASKQ